MKSMKITVYTIPDCPFCKQTKDYLTAKGLPFDEKDVLNNKDFLAEMLQKSQNFAGVPFTLIEDGGASTPLKGFTASEFDEALSKVGGADTGAAAAMPSASPQQPKMVTDPAVTMPQSVTPKPLDPVSMPSMNQSVPMAPSAPIAMDSTSSVDAGLNMSKPAEPAMPKPTATFQAPQRSQAPSSSMPNMGTNSQPLPASSGSDDPQKELNSLLEDLQTKVDVADPMPAAPMAPVTESSAMPASQSPVGMSSDSFVSTSGTQMPSAPTGQSTPPVTPDLPDFSKPQ